jgi:hypothetical protein
MEYPDDAQDHYEGAPDEGGEDETLEAQSTEDGGDDAEGAHAEGDDAEDGGDEGSDAASPPPAKGQATTGKGRAAERIRRQQAELNASREREAAAVAELQRIQQANAAFAQQQQEARNRQYLDSLDPYERQRVEMDMRLNAVQQQVQMQQAAIQEQNDRIMFQANAANNPIYTKYAARVEQHLAMLRAQGQTAPRENVLKYLVGEDMVQKAPKAIQSQRNAAAGRVKAASGTPPRSRGNASGGADTDSMSALEARLAGKTF